MTTIHMIEAEERTTYTKGQDPHYYVLVRPVQLFGNNGRFFTKVLVTSKRCKTGLELHIVNQLLTEGRENKPPLIILVTKTGKFPGLNWKEFEYLVDTSAGSAYKNPKAAQERLKLTWTEGHRLHIIGSKLKEHKITMKELREAAKRAVAENPIHIKPDYIERLGRSRNSESGERDGGGYGHRY